jgi:hypothetical protein
MPLTKQNLNVTELDFHEIKKNLIEYFSRGDSPFRDWNFEGSGLNILLDALAYNTHYNAVLAHMSVSEGFIDSAQLRSSVVSLAKLLGYTPRSFVSPTASINISFTARDANSPEIIVLPRGTPFSSIFNNKKYIFVTDDEHILVKNELNRYEKNNIRIRQGSFQTKRIQVNNLQPQESVTYEIDDSEIDLSTLLVKVFSSPTSSVADIYNLVDDVTLVNENSPIYFISENTNENFQISFGNGVFGKKPSNLSVIEVSYLITEGSNANGCNSFIFAGALPTGIIRAPIVSTASIASGGSEKESIESVRYNAPLSFITQNRAVTADDYKNLLYKHFSDAQTISVWGGENNDPPIYGKVFISIKPNGANILTPSQRDDVLAFLNGKKILSILPELIDPEYLQLNLDVFFKYNRNMITRNLGEIENSIREVVNRYNEDNLQSFDGIFRYSTLTSAIDSWHPAILNSHVRVFVSKTTTFDPFAIEKKRLNFGTRLIANDNGRVIIASTPFKAGGVDVYFEDEPIVGDSVNRRVFTYYFKDARKTKIIREAGILNVETGTLELSEIFPDEFSTVTFDLLPASNDIAPRRNQLLQIDMNRLFVRGEVDVVAVGGSSRAADYNPFKRDR